MHTARMPALFGQLAKWSYHFTKNIVYIGIIENKGVSKMKKSNVVILLVDMVTGWKLVEVSVAATQDKCGKYYVKRLFTNLSNYWCWKSAANYLPEVKADGHYTAIRFEV